MNKFGKSNIFSKLLVLVEVSPSRAYLSLFKQKRAPLLLVALLLVSTLANFAFPFSVSAASNLSSTSSSPRVRAEAYNLMRVVGQCVQYSMRNRIYVDRASGTGDTTPSEAGGSGGDTGRANSQFEWFMDLKTDGHIVQPSGQRVTCASATQQFMGLLGYTNGKAFLQSIGFTFDASSAVWKSPDNNGSVRRSHFIDGIKAKMGGSPLAYNAEAQHINAVNALVSGDCKAELVSPYSSATAAQKKLADDKTRENGRAYAKVTVADGKATKDYIYSYAAESVTPGGTAGTTSTTTSTKGYFWRTFSGNGVGGGMAANESKTCTELISEISRTASALVNWNKTHPGQEESVAKPDKKNASANSVDDEEGVTSCVIEYIGWIACPVLNALAGLADWAYGFLAENFLVIQPTMFNQNGALFQAWAAFQGLANVVLVILFLIIIFSQLTSIGISNYSIKKMFPRLIVGAILINLSFIICTLAIDLSNILGYGLNDLFRSIGTDMGRVGDGTYYNAGSTGEGAASFAGWAVITTSILAGGALAVSGSGAVAAIGMGLVALLPVLLSVFLALVMIFFILVGRQMLIILLVAIAPVAFALYLLPNTAQWFTKWRKTFTALLMVFPIIGLVYGVSSLASQIMSSVIGDPNSPDNWIGQIVSAGVMVIPLIIVPSLLKKSLDSVGSIGSMAGKLNAKLSGGAQSKLAGSGLNKHYENLAAKRRAEITSGTYKGRNSIARVRSNMSGRRNRSDTYNALTGGYGNKLSRMADKLKSQEVLEMAESMASWTTSDGIPRSAESILTEQMGKYRAAYKNRKSDPNAFRESGVALAAAQVNVGRTSGAKASRNAQKQITQMYEGLQFEELRLKEQSTAQQSSTNGSTQGSFSSEAAGDSPFYVPRHASDTSDSATVPTEPYSPKHSAGPAGPTSHAGTQSSSSGDSYTPKHAAPPTGGRHAASPTTDTDHSSSASSSSE